MIWSQKEECMEEEELRSLQLARLQDTVLRVYEKVPFYRDRLDEASIHPERIHSLDHLSSIPFTTKEDLRLNYPYGLLTLPLEKILRLHASSGTTGKPTVVGYTRRDLENWTQLVARIVVLGGARPHDVAQIAFGYGLFTGAFGLHYGLEEIGATVIPASSGNTKRQIMMMQDFKTTLLVSTPSYALYMAEVAEDMEIDPRSLSLRLGLFGAEGSTEEMRKEIEKKWGICSTENYGLSEIIGPGVSGECPYHTGLHIAEDHFLPEIIHPETGEVLKEGEKGELVLTTINKEGLPLLRYRTRDITSLTREVCPCGRTLARMSRVEGRSDDMLIIRGVNVFPSQIEEILMGMEEIGPHYEIIVRKRGYLDELEINVELLDKRLLDRYRELEVLEKTIRHHLKATLSLDSKVNLVEPRTLQRFEGKAKRVKDLR